MHKRSNIARETTTRYNHGEPMNYDNVYLYIGQSHCSPD
jgi:hypothetical protein